MATPMTTEPAAERDEPRGRAAAALRLIALAAIVVAAVVLVDALGLARFRDPETLAEAIRGARALPALPALFVGAYVVATALGLPGTALTLAGGAIFGVAYGTALNWLGATLGAAAAYGLARALGRGATRRLVGRYGDTLDRLSREHGFATVFRLRLIPLVPFNALNFASGLAGIRARDYVLATALGIVPGTAVYTYFADALVAGVAGARDEALLHVGVAGGLLLLLSFVPALAKRLGLAPAGEEDR